MDLYVYMYIVQNTIVMNSTHVFSDKLWLNPNQNFVTALGTLRETDAIQIKGAQPQSRDIRYHVLFLPTKSSLVGDWVSDPYPAFFLLIATTSNKNF